MFHGAVGESEPKEETCTWILLELFDLPEQQLELPLSPTARYSLGATMFEMLTEEKPFGDARKLPGSTLERVRALREIVSRAPCVPPAPADIRTYRFTGNTLHFTFLVK